MKISYPVLRSSLIGLAMTDLQERRDVLQGRVARWLTLRMLASAEHGGTKSACTLFLLRNTYGMEGR